MIDIFSNEMFKSCLSTLRNTSEDKRNVKNVFFMTQSDREVIDFDKVKTKYIKPLGLKEIPKSNDALFDGGQGILVFVEFKNGVINRKEQFDLQKKIYDSILIFSDLTKMNISELRSCMEYILVYNEEVNSSNPEILKKKEHVQPSKAFDQVAKTIASYAKREYVCFGLDMFQKYCFKRVHTYTVQEFEEYLQGL